MKNTPWSYRLYRLTWQGLDLLFPPTCGGCGKLGWRWCADCQSRVPRIQLPFCQKCGIPAQRMEPCETSASGVMRFADQIVCAKCLSNPPAYQMMRSWAVFDSPVQNGLHAMKYRGNIAFGESLASQMVDFVRSLDWPIDVLMPVPLGKRRLKERGYNQVGLVARPLAYLMGWMYEANALWKRRETRSQVGLTAAQRSENVQNAYQADSRTVKQRNILLMDDVATTGSTISSATQALLEAGAKEVYVVTIARALAHHSLDRV